MAIPFLNNLNLNDNELQNAKLHVTGTDPGSNQGQIYLHNTQNKFRVYTTGWKNVAFEDWVSSNYGGTVTSVGLSMPSAFSVANSPITSSGTLAVTGAGTTAQYIDGTGALQTFPTGLMTSFTVAGDNGTDQTISNGNTLTISNEVSIETGGTLVLRNESSITAGANWVNNGTFTLADGTSSGTVTFNGTTEVNKDTAGAGTETFDNLTVSGTMTIADLSRHLKTINARGDKRRLSELYGGARVVQKIDSRCLKLIKDYQEVQEDENSGTKDERNKLLTHCTDAWDYFACEALDVEFALIQAELDK